jgi:hypothetical protein
MIRLGSYGEPVCVPMSVWQTAISTSIGHTGYTHAWWRRDCQEYSDILMASADSESEAQRASLCGWRYFRIRESVDAPIGARESVCPASAEGGKRATCADCGLCAGMSTPHARSIVIVRHGFKVPRRIQNDAKAYAAARVDGSIRSLVS